MPSNSLTNTDVVNEALAMIGERVVDSLDDDETEKGRSLRLLYRRVVDEVRDAFWWQELVERVSVVPVAAPVTVEEGWAAYELPNDFERVIEPKEFRTMWWIEGNRLILPATASDSIQIEYISNAKPPHKWSSQFRTCVVHLLAARIAGGLPKSMQIAAALEQRYEQTILPRARAQCSRKDQATTYRPRGFGYAGRRALGNVGGLFRRGR